MSRLSLVLLWIGLMGVAGCGGGNTVQLATATITGTIADNYKYPFPTAGMPNTKDFNKKAPSGPPMGPPRK